MDIKTVRKLIKEYQQKNALYVGHVWVKRDVGIILSIDYDGEGYEELEDWNSDYDMGDEALECPIYEVHCLRDGAILEIMESELKGEELRKVVKAKLKRFDTSRYSKSIEYEYEG